MKHLVLLKFDPNYYSDEILEFTKETFASLQKEVKDIECVNVHSNCVERDSNMDIMIEMDLSNKTALSTYLNHDIHKHFIDVVNDHVTKRVSFDYE